MNCAHDPMDASQYYYKVCGVGVSQYSLCVVGVSQYSLCVWASHSTACVCGRLTV